MSMLAYPSTEMASGQSEYKPSKETKTMKGTEQFTRTIAEYLNGRAATDPLFAPNLAKPHKNIEVSLETMTVIQCRGLQNKNTEYHDRIIDLVNANQQVIRERIKATA